MLLCFKSRTKVKLMSAVQSTPKTASDQPVAFLPEIPIDAVVVKPASISEQSDIGVVYNRVVVVKDLRHNSCHGVPQQHRSVAHPRRPCCLLIVGNHEHLLAILRNAWVRFLRKTLFGFFRNGKQHDNVSKLTNSCIRGLTLRRDKNW